jgi:TonB family protein
MKRFLLSIALLMAQLVLGAAIEYPYLEEYEGTNLNNYERYIASLKVVEKVLQSNIKSSALAEMKSNEDVRLSFVLGKDGKIKKFQVGEGNYPRLSKQIAFLADYLPNNWNPKTDKSVAVDFDTNVFLKLGEENGIKYLQLYGPPPPPPEIWACGYYRLYKKDASFPSMDFKARSAKEQKESSTKALLKFIYDRIEYPSAATKQGIEGVVVIRFIVQTDGTLTDHEIVRDIGGGCGEEALRVIKLMPRWMPAIDHKGRPAKQAYNMPVKFRTE